MKHLTSLLCAIFLIVTPFCLHAAEESSSETIPVEKAAAESSVNTEDSKEKNAEPESEKATVNAVSDPEEESITLPLASSPVPQTFLYTGAATHSIPIAVSPGRAGIAPNMSLQYNSYTRNGWIGVGWSLDMGAIQRSVKRGVDYDDTDSDNDFIATVNGATSDLVPRPEWNDSSTDEIVPYYYGARIEGAFSKFFYYDVNPGNSDSTDTAWKVLTKDGKVYYYGTTSASRQENTHGVFKWCLDRVEDPNGNYMSVSYYKDGGEIYPKQIKYTGNTTTGLGTSNKVEFKLEDRADAPLKYQSCSEVVTAKRLKSIDIYGSGNFVRKYELSYTLSEGTSRSVLTSVKLFGNDSQSSYITNYSYYTAPNGFSDIESPLVNDFGGNFGGWDSQSKNPRMMADVNGDAAADVVGFKDDGVWVALALPGEGGFSEPSRWVRAFGEDVPSSMPAGDWEDIHLRTVADVNGDGKADLIGFDDDTHNVYVSIADPENMCFTTPQIWGTGWGGSGWAREGRPRFLTDVTGDGKADIVGFTDHGVYVSTSSGSEFNKMARWSSGYCGTYWDNNNETPRHLADANGDGMADIVGFGQNGVYVSLSTGNDGNTFKDPELWIDYYGVSHDWAGGNAYEFEKHSIRRLADVNGDGMVDIVGVWNAYYTNTYVSLSTGTGFTTPKIWDWNKRNEGSPFPYTVSFSLADVNGDNMVDMVTYPADGGVYVSLSTGVVPDTLSTIIDKENVGFKTPVSWVSSYSSNSPFDGPERNDIRTLADVNGDGRADLVGFSDFGVFAGITGNAPVDLLSSIKGYGGGRADIEYKPSSHYSNHTLPYVVQTVKKITANDGFDNTIATQYEYQGGHIDIADREFRGFEIVRQINPDGKSFTESVFEQEDDFLKGKQKKGYLKQLSNKAILDKTIFTWGTYNIVSAGSSEDWCRFPRLKQKKTTSYDNGSQFFIKETFNYDNTHGSMLYAKTSDGTSSRDVSTTYRYLNLSESDTWMWRLRRVTVTGATSGRLRRTTSAYDDRGNNTSVTNWLEDGSNPRIKFTYDDYGNQITAVNARGKTTTTLYDDSTRTYPVKITLSNGLCKSYSYDYGFGTVLSTTDENSHKTTYTYDPFGRLIETNYPDGGQSVIEYYGPTEYQSPFSPLYVKKSIKTPGQESWIDSYEYYDGLGRNIQSVSPGEDGSSVLSRSYYDDAGRNYRTSGPFHKTHIPGSVISPASSSPWTETTSWDTRGRALVVKSSDGLNPTPTTRFTYAGLATTVTDPDGNTKTQETDVFGRLKKVIENNQTTLYDYNEIGELTKVEDPHKNITRVWYDTLGRKTSMSDPDMGTWSYTYDKNSNLISQTDAMGKTITMEYDSLNRITEKDYGDSQTDYYYDLSGVSNGKGRLCRVSNENVTTTYHYDMMGRSEKVIKHISGDNQDRTTTYTYDIAGRPTGMTYPGNNFELSYSYYPGTGLLHTLEGSDMRKYAEFSDYEPIGKIGTVEYSNGVTTSYSYDARSTRLTSIFTNTGNEQISKNYDYTPGGSLESIAPDPPSVKLPAAFTYGYKLNSFGNNTHELTSVIDQSTGTAFDDFTYDVNGNMTKCPDITDSENTGTRTIAYNSQHMPEQVTSTATGKTMNLFYDGNGLRAKKTVGGVTTFYVGPHFEIHDNAEEQYIFAGSIRIAMKRGNNTYYFHKDHLGSTIAVTDQTGTVKERIEYLPFGGEAYHAGERIAQYLFTDQEHDSEVNLYNYNARLYDPTLRRFTAADTIVPDYKSPQTLNRYSYCANNPLIYIDPSGHSFLSDLFEDIGDIAEDIWQPVAQLAAGTVGFMVGGPVGAGIGVASVSYAITGDPRSAIASGITAGLFYGAGEFYPGNAYAHAAAGVAGGGIGAAITGGDMGSGMIVGGIAGFSGTYFGADYDLVGRSIIGGFTGGTASLIYGGNFGEGFRQGALTAGSAVIFNGWSHDTLIPFLKNRVLPYFKKHGYASLSVSGGAILGGTLGYTISESGISAHGGIGLGLGLGGSATTGLQVDILSGWSVIGSICGGAGPGINLGVGLSQGHNAMINAGFGYGSGAGAAITVGYSGTLIKW